MIRPIPLLAASFLLILAIVSAIYAVSPKDTPVYAQEASGVSLFLPTVRGVAEEEEEEEEDNNEVVESTDNVITLQGTSISVSGSGAVVDGSIVTITDAGAYSITGDLSDGQIVVDTEDEGDVILILDGVNIANSTSAPFFIASADQAVIVLAKGTQNTLADASTYVYADPEEDEPDAALFSKADLTIRGEGSLTVTGNYGDGIVSKDGLIISGGAIVVNAVDDGIRGKDYLLIEDGVFTITAGGDGLKSTEDEDAAKGFIIIEGGTFAITAANDAIQAETSLAVSGGNFTFVTGGGSNTVIGEDVSAKGLKAEVNISIDGGVFVIDAADDGIHSNGDVTVNSGEITIATADDGVHAEGTVTVNGGVIDVVKSYEGIEGTEINLNAGTIRVVSSDDGINVAGDIAASYTLTIAGGYIVVDAGGDGIDVNGSIVMTGGVVLVNGPTQSMNGAIDYDRTFNISGGFLVAAGSSGMAQAPSNSSSQYSVLVNLNATQAAGTLFHIQNASGEDILTFAPSKVYQSVAFSSSELGYGESYQVYLGGTASGDVADGLYADAVYTPGTQYTSFTISGMVTQVGSGGGRPRR